MNATRLPAYEREPYRTALDASILEVKGDAGRLYAVLDDTILFPEGGGQPPDHGFLNEVEVLDVQKADGEIRHYVAARVAPGPVRVRLDWDRRFDHMQQHTGQHLLSAIAQDGFGWPTTAFHLGPEVCDVELEARSLSPADLTALEDAVATQIRAARSVLPRRVTLDEFRALNVRTRGLPEDHAGDVRLVEIEGVDLNTCGGTHLSSTAEIEVWRSCPSRLCAAGRASSSWRGGGRGGDSRATRSGTPLSGLCSVRRMPASRAPRRRSSTSWRTRSGHFGGPRRRWRPRRWRRRWLRARASCNAHFEGRDMAFVQAVARRFSEKAGPRAVLLTATRDGQHVFALGVGAGFGDAQALGREIASLLGGKGGGAGRVFQGKAPGLLSADRAVARLNETPGS